MSRAASLDVRGLERRVGRTSILGGVDLTARAGAVTGILGPNGSGKSTLLRILAGAQRPDAGAVRLGDEDLLAMSRRDRSRRIAFVEQQVTPHEPINVLEAVLLGRTPYRSAWGSRSGHDLSVALRSLQRSGAGHLRNRDYESLSGGERQRVQIARALAQEPDVLLLDEPSNHLDVGAQLALLDHVTLLAADGVTVVIAMHDLNQAISVCDQVVLLNGGVVVAAGDPVTVLTTDRIRAVYGVESRLIDDGDHRVLAYAKRPVDDRDRRPAVG